MKQYKLRKTILLFTIILCSCIALFSITLTIDFFIVDFSLIGSKNIIVNFNDEYIDDGYIATVTGKKVENVRIENNLDTSKIGKYKIKYTLSYGLYNRELVRNIEVVDNVKPVLLVECDDEILISTNETFNVKYSAVDNYDGDITENVKIETNLNTSKKGSYYVKYIVNDSSNNITSKTIKVNVKDKFEHTYVKVSISEQKLRYYVKDKLVLESDVVTGMNNATKTGKFKVQKKVRDTVLEGKDYTSHVKYWIQYNGSFGIHDASWRNKFGGKIYKTNGSHGCVNTPLDKVSKLYNMIEIGTPVYIEK